MKSTAQKQQTSEKLHSTTNTENQTPLAANDDFSSLFKEEVKSLRKGIDKDNLIDRLPVNTPNTKKVEEDLLAQLSALEKSLSLIETRTSVTYPENMLILQHRIKEELDRVFSDAHADEYGMPVHPLRAKALSLVTQAEDGFVFQPEYRKGQWNGKPDDKNRNVWSNPIEYLEDVLGEFLVKYNDKEDYLYLNELTKISKKFRNTLDVFIRRHPEYGCITDYIPPKAKRLDKEANILLKNKQVQRQTKKFISLAKSRG